MASSAIKTEEEKKEYFDSPEELDAKVTQLAEWVRTSLYFTAFTGAGISTSAGIPDYRSGFDTVIPTGPGAWEKAAAKKRGSKKTIRTEMTKAIPSPTHMAFVELMNLDRLKFLVSQNIDGLHRRSGISPNKLSELHGNQNLEICKQCGKEYMRDFRVRTANQPKEHQTGRLCENMECRGALFDSIINFGEGLNPNILRSAFHSSQLADLCLAMGSSLRVTPACNIAEQVAESGGRLVIVNLQKTPLDEKASLIIHAFCDTVMSMLFEKLSLQIPPFKLVRRIRITKREEIRRKETKPTQVLHFQGIDSDQCPFSLYPKIEVKFSGDQGSESLTKEPMKLYRPRFRGIAEATLHFARHYNEPPLQLTFDTDGLTQSTWVLTYDPHRGEWESIVQLP